MNTANPISRVYKASEQIAFDDSSRIVLISDCHRGDGSWADDFARNRHIYYAALTHYYENNYVYIEIGDGDELWENKNFSDIVRVHGDVFLLLSRFFNDGRLYSIFGNHDIVKDAGLRRRRFHYMYRGNYYGEHEKRDIALLDGVRHREGLVLKHIPTGGEIFLIHGHQADFFNYRVWKVSRFLVRYVWRPLELHGIKDPTSAAENNGKAESVERKLIEWVKSNDKILVAGHTHRPMFPEPGKPPYFNDGCCIHPHCITAIEIAGGRITLVKWEVKTGKGGAMYVGKEVLAGPKDLREYFDNGKEMIK